MSSTTRSKHELPQLPATDSVTFGRRAYQLALFWRRDDNDALSTLAGLFLLKLPIRVSNVNAAIAVLRTYDSPDAHAFADQLWSRTLDRTHEKPAWYTHVPPGATYLRKKRPNCEYRCSFFIEPTTKLQCSMSGAYVVDGARGTFCGKHARYAIQRIARKRARQSRKAKAVSPKGGAASPPPEAAPA